MRPRCAVHRVRAGFRASSVVCIRGVSQKKLRHTAKSLVWEAARK
jgi:hypothetical protein